MLNSLITSQTRIKLLLKFFINSNTKAHLRGLESEFGESTNGIRVELNRLEQAKLLKSSKSGNRKYYQANTGHPLFREIHNIILKETGIDRVIERIVARTGNIIRVYLTGSFAKGLNSDLIELLIVGNSIDREYLKRKIVQAGRLARRRVKYKLIEPQEENDFLAKMNEEELLVLWSG